MILTERRKKIGYHIAITTSAAAAALSFCGSVYKASDRDMHYQKAAGIVRQIDHSLPPSGVKILVELNRVTSILSQGDPGDQVGEELQARKQELGAELVAIELHNGQGEQILQEQRARAAGNRDGSAVNNLIYISGASSFVAFGLGIASGRASRRRKADLLAKTPDN